MGGTRVTILLFIYLRAVSSSTFICPGKCRCSHVRNSPVLMDCSAIGLTEFPPLGGALDFNTLRMTDFEDLGIAVAVDLSKNDITEAAFPKTMRGLSKIDLTGNAIDSLKKVSISDAKTLQELDLSHNKLERISDGLESGSLRVLTLRNCSARELSTGFLDRVPFVKRLDMSWNMLQRFFLSESSGFFQPRPPTLHLTHLNLSRNALTDIRGKDLARTKITTFDASVNSLTDLRFTVFLRQVQYLNVSENQLEDLVDAVLPHVVYLDASRNKIKELLSDFTKIAPKLRTLRLSENPVGVISSVVSHSIAELDLSYCHVQFIEEGAFGAVPELTSLDLRGNRMATLDAAALMDGLVNVYLEKNPWMCNCESEEFVTLYRFVVTEKKFYAGEELLCEKGMTWAAACKRDGELQMTKRTTFYTLLCIVLSLMLALLLCVCFRCMRTARQSASMSLEGPGMESWETSPEVRIPEREACSIPYEHARRSTPPPNYEAALLLPQLSEEERNLAISTLSLDRVSTNDS